MLGNDVDGDCVVAATEHLRMCQNVTKASTVKRVLYRLGFRPPHTGYTLELYAQYLATLNEKPSATTGVYPEGWFTWLKSRGLIKDFGSVDFTKQLLVQQAMIDHRGVLLTMSLTPSAIGKDAVPDGLWTVDSGRGDQPNKAWQHAVALVEYNTYSYGIVTWGEINRLTRDYFAACVDGCWWFE
jgi:hypothetical protein